MLTAFGRATEFSPILSTEVSSTLATGGPESCSEALLVFVLLPVMHEQVMVDSELDAFKRFSIFWVFDTLTKDACVNKRLSSKPTHKVGPSAKFAAA